MDKEFIIKRIRTVNEKYQREGFLISSLFGSYARDEADEYSDIDLTYTINHDKFFKDDAFAKLDKIDLIKKELSAIFHKKIDLIPSNTSNTLIQKSLQKEQISI